MAHGKQIRLFLTDGDASGIRYAELVNWTGQAFSFPWVLRSGLKNWEETHRPGVYVLVGLDESGKGTVYIGESENVFQRLVSHASAPPITEVTQAFFFTSKDDNLTKGHVTYLERKLIDRAESAKRYFVKCGRSPSEKRLSRPELATMEEFVETLYLVAAALGYDVFDIPGTLPIHTSGSAVEFVMELPRIGISAVGYRSEDGFVVKENSHAAPEGAATLSGSYQELRSELTGKGVLVDEAGQLRFTQDYTFSSSSAAAAVVGGANRSGPQTWLRSSDRKTLKEVEAEEAAADAPAASNGEV